MKKNQGGRIDTTSRQGQLIRHHLSHIKLITEYIAAIEEGINRDSDETPLNSADRSAPKLP